MTAINHGTHKVVKRQIKAILKSMDFVSNNYLRKEKKAKKDFQVYFDIYQQLGLAWEFLGLQCEHWEGYKKTRGNKEVCRMCGKVKDVDDVFVLVSKKGPKKIGVTAKPNSKKTFDSKKDAEIINDTVNFHGASLNVDVHNAYRSRIFGKGITMAAERIVTVKEDNTECQIDQHLVHVRLNDANRKSGKKKYGGFPWEIAKKDLKRFPVIFDFDEKHRFLGLTILR